jgi:hypothetical protein
MKNDSNKGTPLPADAARKAAKPANANPANDDESVDFRHHPGSEENVSGLSGAKSGSSVLTWDELVRQQNADDQVELGANASESSVDFDAASDHDILREVLAGEKPPSKVIPRTKSHPELKVDVNAPQLESSRTATNASPPNTAPTVPIGSGTGNNPRVTPVEDDDDASFHIGVDTSSGDGSSILSSLGIEAGSFTQSGEMTSGSRVDLLAHLRPKGGASSVPAGSDEIKSLSRDDEAQYGDEYADDDDSSAVDLGSREVVDMPYPLGVDSSVNSSVLGGRHGTPSSSQSGGDSAAVDLLDPANEFNLHRQPGMSSVVEALRGDSGHDLPPTVPMSPISRDRVVAWAGGSAIGLLASALVFALLYSTGLVRFGSDNLAKPVVNTTARGPETQNSPLLSELTAVRNQYTDLEKKTAADAAAAKNQLADARAKSDKAAQDLQASTLEKEKLADEARRLREQVEGLNQQANQGQGDFKAQAKRNDEARIAAEKALKDAEARLARLTAAQQEKADAATKAAEDRVRAEASEAATAKKALAEFQHALNLKLSDANLLAGNAKPADLLAGVDKALERRTPVIHGNFDSLQAERLFSSGLRAYRDRDFGLAEQHLASAIKANDRDARVHYLLGLARYQLGRHDEAQAEFYAAAALERQYLPSPREVDEIFARLPSSDRSVVGQYRP